MNTFSNISKLTIFDQITICANEFLSVNVRAYREHYGTQHKLIWLLEK